MVGTDTRPPRNAPPLPAALVCRGTSGILHREGRQRLAARLRLLRGRAATAVVDEVAVARRGFPYRGEHRQAAERAASDIEGHSEAAKFSQPGRLSARVMSVYTDHRPSRPRRTNWRGSGSSIILTRKHGCFGKRAAVAWSMSCRWKKNIERTLMPAWSWRKLQNRRRNGKFYRNSLVRGCKQL